MKTVVFRTPGLIDIRAFTTFGVNSKPNSQNPIGYFGTGLKYAIAVLVRESIPVKLFIGETEYEFYKSKEEFRDREFNFVRMRKRKGMLKRWQYEKLPFTTELGKNWSLWQAFRELEANTRDEQGFSFDMPENHVVDVGQEQTVIRVYSDDFADIWYNRDDIFLPGGLTEREGSDSIQVFDAPTNYVYYRGLRVHELKERSQLTYNILTTMELTEDRTLKNPYVAEIHIRDYIAAYANTNTIRKVLKAPNDSFEQRRIVSDYAYSYTSPSEPFLEVAKEVAKTKELPSVQKYVERFIPQEEKLPSDENTPLEERLQWWLDSGEIAGYPDLKDLIRETITTLQEYSAGQQLLTDEIQANKQADEDEAKAESEDLDDDIPF